MKSMLPRTVNRQRNPGAPFLTGLVAGLMLALLLLAPQLSRRGGPASQSVMSTWNTSKSTLVTYIHREGEDPAYADNLQDFIDFIITPDTGSNTSYLLVVQPQLTDRITQAAVLPTLPGHAQYVRHNHDCSTWGTWGWLLKSEHVPEDSSYAFFVLLTSAARGPFLPPTMPKGLSWTRLFTDRLSADVKMVGPAISCTTPANPGDNQSAEGMPHLAPYAVATDAAGLDVLLRQRGVLSSCEADEYAAAAAVLDAGFNLDCFLSRYQGIDWRDRSSWMCNQGLDPTLDGRFDGVSAEMFELVFVQVAQRHLNNPAGNPDDFLENQSGAARLADAHSRWQRRRAEGKLDIRDNAAMKPHSSGAARLAQIRSQGSKCFDHAFYKAANPDLDSMPNDELWQVN